jgi:hypothetical protein
MTMAGFNPFMFGNPTSLGQQTAVGQALISNGSGRMTGTRRKKRRTKAAAPRKRARKRAGKPARLVKGSKAAKLHMAKIRRRRK